MKYQLAVLWSLVLAVANCQQVAVRTPEYHPPFPIQSCDASGCVTENTAVVMDVGARRILSVANNDVYCLGTDGWDYSLCPDGIACAQNCGVDGISQDEYVNRYGVSTEGSSLRLDYYTESEFGLNIGARLYIIGEDNNYRLFHLKNRELSVTADISTLPCGLNGALYFSEMDGDGGTARFPDNAAGAAYGLGYCDGQCPHNLRFSNGQLNTDGTEFGICCTEMDILEANRWASTYTTHGCLTDGYYACYDVDCGDGDNYYNGLCDKTGCEFSPARQNNRYFLGYNSSFELQTSQPFTAVTQFITDDGTDTGNLVEIRRRWFQNGVEIPNPVANWGYSQDYDSINDGYCNEYKSVFGEYNDYTEQGGLDSMGAAFERGMVLAFSLWEDEGSYMQWLDSLSPPDGDPATPGVYRGPCPVDAGRPEDNHANSPDAFVTFSDIKIGTIGSTF